MTQYKLFELVDPPSQDDVDATMAVLSAYSFPWQWTVYRNVRETGKPILYIGYEDKSGSYGWYDSVLNGVHTDPIAVLGAQRFGWTLAHELGHLIDDTVLTNETRHLIHALMHEGSTVPLVECPSEGYWGKGKYHNQRPREAFANLAPRIWCPLHAKPIQNYGPHYFTKLDEIEGLVMSDAEQQYPFTDVEGTTHEEAILWAVENGLVTGFKDGTFRPNQPMTRGQLASVLKKFKEQL